MQTTSDTGFRTLLELSSDWFWEQDAAFRFSGGQLRPGALGKRRWEFRESRPLAGTWDEHRALLEAHQPYRNFEYSRADGKGGTEYISANGEPVFGANGRFEGYRGVSTNITDRKRTEAALRESEARLRSLTAMSSDWYWEQDENYRFVPVAASAQGRSDGGHVRFDQRARWESPGNDLTEAQWAAHRAELDARRPFLDFEYGRLDADGARQYVSISGEPIFDGDGNFKGYRGIGKDITGRKRAESLLALEHTVARCLADADSESAALHLVISAMCATELWDCGRYYAVDEEAGLMRMRDAWGIAVPEVERFIEASREIVFRPGEGLAGRVWQSGQALWSSDTSTDPRVKTVLPRESGIHGAFVLPIMSEGRTIGVITFSSRRIREPDERMLAAATAIGGQIGQFLQRKRTEAVLRKSEERFRSLTSLSSDWYWEQDTEFRFTKFEGKGSEQGDPAKISAIVGKCGWDLGGVAGDALSWDQLRTRQVSHQSFRNFEYSYRDRAGKRHFISADGEPVFDEAGAFAGYRGTSRDVTKGRRDEELQRRFRAAMDATADAIYLTDRASMRFLDVNAAACRMQGCTREELLARGPDGVLGQTREELARNYDSVIAGGGGAETFELLRPRKDGSQAWVELQRRAQRSGDGWTIITVVRDITSRKQAELAVAHQSLQHSLVAGFGQQALASTDVDDLLQRAIVIAREGLGVSFCRVIQAGTEQVREVADATSQFSFVMSGREAVIVDDLGREARFVPAADLTAAGVLSMVEVPVAGASGKFGVLGVYATEPRRFSPDTARFLQSLANILATAIDRRSIEQRLANLAQFDTLTGLPNRSLFLDRLAQTLAQARRNKWLVGVMFVDLDRFKAVNDTFGHGVGDKLLIQVAQRLQDCVRSSDTVARLGGDEFAVLLSNLAKADDAGKVAQKAVAALSLAFDLDGHEAYISASVGIAIHPGDGDEAEVLLKNADTAMYRAKEEGRNTYQFYLAQMNERAVERLQMETQLRGALERGEFLLHYQPKASLTSGEISGFEALLRWQHPQRGMVAPLEFISILEETGLIVPVGEWVVRAACAQLASWRAAGVEPRPIAVNLSARQFQQKNFDAVIGGILNSAGIEPHLLEFELTESMLMSDPEAAVRTLKSMKAYGVRLSVDDFGTGYSSLAYLKRFPLDALKIDRAFIRDVTIDPDDAIIAVAIISLAHNLKLKVVAEGVETAAQLGFLRLHGCDEMQGYYFSRPLAIEECTRALREKRRLE